jgi:polyisoprenoid-binding protein YceI
MEVRGGIVTFAVDTNVSGIRVRGRSRALQATFRLTLGTDDPGAERIEAVVPVDSLETGLRLRDDHMRAAIFTTPEGERPDVRFSADKSVCRTAARPRERVCQLTGALTIRGSSRPFTIDLKVIDLVDRFSVSGDTVVKLSVFGIEAPSQLGVQTLDDVRLHVEFTARKSTPIASAGSSAFP